MFFQEFNFKLFDYLLYSQKEQNKQSVLIKGDKNGMFMKLGSRAGVFHQEAYIPFSKDEEVMLQWRNELHKLHGPRFNFLLYKHSSTTHAKCMSPQYNETHVQQICIDMFVYSNFYKATWMSLHSLKATVFRNRCCDAQGMCFSICIGAKIKMK